MQILPNTSIRRKQMLVILLTSTIALLLACSAFTAYEVISFRQNMVKDLSSMAQILGDNTAGAIDFNDPEAATEALAGLKSQPDIIGAAIYTKSGQILAKYDRANDKIVFNPPPVTDEEYVFQNRRLTLFRPISHNGEIVGTICLESDMRELYDRLTNYAGIVAVVFVSSLLLSLLLSNRLQKLIMRPILDLSAVARSVAEKKNYSARVVKQSNDEIGQLIDGFNEMLSQIQERDANLERRVEERTRQLQAENNERKRVEEAVRESQALYHSLVDQLPAGVFRKDAEGRYEFVNSWFCRVKNATPEHFLGKTPAEVAAVEAAAKSPNDLPNRVQLTAQGTSHHDLIMKNGKPIEQEEEYLDAKGKAQYFHVVKSGVFDHEGKVVGTQGILFDVTQRKQIEAKLAYERDLLGALMDHSDDSIYFKDRASRFLRCSVSMASAFGRQSSADLIGRRDQDFFSTDHAEEAFVDEQRIIQTGEPMIGKIEKETWPDGRLTWALTSKMPFRNNAGEIIGTFGISKDITAIKDAEDKLAQVHKQLMDASRQAGMAEIATSVLHNVGNVLNSVNVSNSLVTDKVRNSKLANFSRAVALMQEHKADLGDFFKNDPKGRQLPDYFSSLATHLVQEQQEILQEVNSLGKNISHIKEIVAMQQSYAKASGVLESLKITELVEDAIRMNNGAMARHQVKVVREMADVPPILTDKHKVLQILINLIRNAKYACDDSGRVDKQITLRVAHDRDYVKVSVIDNGVGIPPENLTRIFNHGFTTRKEGHGFGLHSGALAAKEMGGALTVASEGTGRGAAFMLELPVKMPAMTP